MKLTILLSLLLSACSLDTKKTDMPQYSHSIQESKRIGVFIQTLNVNKPTINIGDNKTDTIKQIWLENEWKYESKYIFSTVIKKDTFQQILILFGELSNKLPDSILLKYNNEYFGWNRVLFNRYLKNKDSVFVIKKVAGKETNLDTVVIKK
jgi:hypothetical protein